MATHFRSEGRKSTFYIAKEDFHRKILIKALNFSSAMGIRDSRGAPRKGTFQNPKPWSFAGPGPCLTVVPGSVSHSGFTHVLVNPPRESKLFTHYGAAKSDFRSVREPLVERLQSRPSPSSWPQRQMSYDICRLMGRSVYPLYHSVNGTSSGRRGFDGSWGGRCPPRLGVPSRSSPDGRGCLSSGAGEPVARQEVFGQPR